MSSNISYLSSFGSLGAAALALNGTPEAVLVVDVDGAVAASTAQILNFNSLIAGGGKITVPSGSTLTVECLLGGTGPIFVPSGLGNVSLTKGVSIDVKWF